MESNHAWMYWENLPNGARPPYLDLCLQTIRRHLGSLELHLLDERSVLDWLPELQADVWHKLPTPVYRADYARTRLVHRYGGLWLDFDSIAIDSLDKLLKPLDRAELAGWGCELGGRFYNNLFAGRPGAEVLERWIIAQDDVLSASTNWRKLTWAALGQDIIGPISREHGYHCLPMHQIAPVPWYEWRRFLSRCQSPGRILVHSPITILLWNKQLGPILNHVSREAILKTRTLLARLLRIALGLSSVEQEIDHWSRLHLISDLRFTPPVRSLEIRAQRFYRAARRRSRNDFSSLMD